MKLLSGIKNATFYRGLLCERTLKSYTTNDVNKLVVHVTFVLVKKKLKIKNERSKRTITRGGFHKELRLVLSRVRTSY